MIQCIRDDRDRETARAEAATVSEIPSTAIEPFSTM
jgi:hypothetical protein